MAFSLNQSLAQGNTHLPNPMYAMGIDVQPHPQVVLDQEGTILHINRKALEVLSPLIDLPEDRLREKLLGRNIDEIIPEYRSFFFRSFEETANKTHKLATAENFGKKDITVISSQIEFVPEEPPFILAEINLIKEDTSLQTGVEAKYRTLQHISHELRSLVISIGLSTKQLAEDVSEEKIIIPEEHKDNYITLLASVHSLSNMLEDFALLTNLQQGTAKLTPINHNLHEFCKDCLLILGIQAHEKKLIFETEIDPTIPDNFSYDDSALLHIIYNLVRNAIKFTEQGNVKLRVNLIPIDQIDPKELAKMDPISKEKLTAAPYIIRFDIVDTGKGIPEEKIDQVFEEFSQVEAEGVKTKGNGFGLSLVKKLSLLMGGHIPRIKSTLGEGSTFSVLLPFNNPTAESPRHKAVEEVAPAADIRAALASLRLQEYPILIAEDNTLNQRVMKAMLSKKGYDFKIVNNGQEALEALKHGQYSLVLMDIEMPKLQGDQATRAYRSEEKALIQTGSRIRTPIFALTANTIDRVLDEKYRESGMDGALEKPLTWPKIEGIIKQHVGEGRKKETAIAIPAMKLTTPPGSRRGSVA